MNEGEYLELVNDLKKQYDEMKEGYMKTIAFLKQNNAELKKDLGLMHPLQYSYNQFYSRRPCAPLGEYTYKTKCDFK